jgi:glycerol-1-phosphate dehydrogenase [NAD(P)+]
LPTALSVDAFLTWASGIRVDGCVSYIETGCPETLIVDFKMISSGPESLRSAGICDVLSIATGNWDWHFADSLGKNAQETPLVAYAAQCADGILQGVLDCAPAAGQGDEAGLRQLLECLALQVQLCNFLGHSRPEEGSEHYFAYAVENIMGQARAGYHAFENRAYRMPYSINKHPDCRYPGNADSSSRVL